MSDSGKCEVCGNELFEGHYSKICHKDACIGTTSLGLVVAVREFIDAYMKAPKREDYYPAFDRMQEELNKCEVRTKGVVK